MRPSSLLLQRKVNAMKKKPLAALMDENEIVYFLFDFIFKNTARFERVYPDGRIEQVDKDDINVISEHFYS